VAIGITEQVRSKQALNEHLMMVLIKKL